MTTRQRSTPSRRKSEPAELEARVGRIRAFNRFYTQQVGALEEHLLSSTFSLAEARVLYEVAQRQAPTAAEIARDLGLDAGYLSRILRRLGSSGLVEQRASTADRRQRALRLTKEGQHAFGALDDRTKREIAKLLQRLGAGKQAQLVEAMGSIERLLDGGEGRTPRSYVLRPPRPGELGWVVYRHGALYAAEYGWGAAFEALVADIVTTFAKGHDPAREACWIADVEGEPLGSIFVMKGSDTIAQLRLLLVEPAARGLGLGKQLIAQTIQFSRQAGYRTLRLWTQSNLAAARHLYQEAGFQLVAREAHRLFGPRRMSETWTLDLQRTAESGARSSS